MREVCVSSLLISEIKRIIKESEIMKYYSTSYVFISWWQDWLFIREDDTRWPQKNKDGRQELEIRLGNEQISFEVGSPSPRISPDIPVGWDWPFSIQTAKIGSMVDVTESQDPEGLRVFYYLVQDLKALVFSLISLHFKVGCWTSMVCFISAHC